MKLWLYSVAVVAALLAASAACGGGEEEATPTPAGRPTATPTAAATAPAATGELTLDIESLEPGAVRVGDTVTVIFVTAPRAYIGLQLIDGAGNTVAQKLVRAGADGKATYDFVADGAPGTWLISAAAGRSLADLYRLQASPVPGPNTVDREFQVQ